MLKFIAFAFAVIVTVQSEPVPKLPCLDSEHFDYQKSDAPGSSTGVLTITTDYKLYGTWIRLFFDRPVKNVAIQKDALSTVWVKETPSEVLLKNRDLILKKGVPEKIYFTVSYEGEKAPALVGYRLNGRDICPGTEE